MNKKNNIAVLLPVYNKDSPIYLVKAIKSIEEQTIADKITILFCIDGPISNSLMDVCKSTLTYHVLQLKKNCGLAENLNQGVRYALEKGYVFIARMDADDISCPSRMELQHNFLLKNPLIDILGGAITIINDVGENQGQTVTYPKTHHECHLFFKRRDPVAHPAVMFRNSYFEKAGIYNPDYKKDQDSELWFRGFLNGCKFANLEETVLKFRQTSDLFKRRSDIKKSLKFFKLRLKINRKLNFGLTSHIYTLSYFVLMMMPGFVKKFIYKRFR